MILLNINGPINARKTTVCRLLEKRLEKSLFIEVDDLLSDADQKRLKLDFEEGINHRLQVLQTTLAQHVKKQKFKVILFAYPMSEGNFRSWKALEKDGIIFKSVTLAPSLEICSKSRGVRTLTKWEVERIKTMYEQGYQNPVHTDLIIDNGHQTPHETAEIIIKYIKLMQSAPNDLAIPLIVDFDGTMQLSDLTLEGLLWVLTTRPWLFFKLMWLHLTKGRAAMKLTLEQMAEKYDWVPVLPWEERVLERIAQEKARGRTVIVVTGSTTKLVKRAITDKGLDYEVIGTENAMVNLTGPRKAAALVERWGVKKFDYIGNSKDDLHVWKEGRYALVIGNNKKVRTRATRLGNVIWELDTPRQRFLRRQLRKRR